MLRNFFKGGGREGGRGMGCYPELARQTQLKVISGSSRTWF